MWFEDLTPYAYSSRGFGPERNTANVGWLSGFQSYPTGEVPVDFEAALAKLVESPVNLYRGSHTCEFCGRAQGNGEIRVVNGPLTYVAPVLVAHYVSAHDYRPPAEFIDAVLRWADG